jgi:hypothetical protein
MIKYTDYSKSKIRSDLLEGYRILKGEEILENFDQNTRVMNLYLVGVRNSGNGEISSIWDTPRLSLMETQDVDYYDEALETPQRNEKAINVCFLNKIDAEEFIKKIKMGGLIFPKFIPRVIIVSPE